MVSQLLQLRGNHSSILQLRKVRQTQGYTVNSEEEGLGTSLSLIPCPWRDGEKCVLPSQGASHSSSAKPPMDSPFSGSEVSRNTPGTACHSSAHHHTLHSRQTQVWQQSVWCLIPFSAASREGREGGGSPATPRFLDSATAAPSAGDSPSADALGGRPPGFTAGAAGARAGPGRRVGGQGHQGGRVRVHTPSPGSPGPQQEGSAGGGPCPLDVPLGLSLVGL